MRPATVQLLAAAFYASGSLATGTLSLKNIGKSLDEKRFVGEQARLQRQFGWLRVFSLGCGVLLGVAMAALVMVPNARMNAARIEATPRLRWFHFYPLRAALGILCVAVTCAIVERSTEEYYFSVCAFVGLLAKIGVALAGGAIQAASMARSTHRRSKQLLDGLEGRATRSDSAHAAKVAVAAEATTTAATTAAAGRGVSVELTT